MEATLAVRIRLRRVGKKKQPHYRVVVTEAKMPRDGRFIESLGSYNPRLDPPTVELDAERVRLWLSRGAQPSDTVRSLLVRQGILSPSEPVQRGSEKPEKDESAAAPSADAPASA